jgi:hypothetical protein
LCLLSDRDSVRAPRPHLSASGTIPHGQRMITHTRAHPRTCARAHSRGAVHATVAVVQMGSSGAVFCEVGLDPAVCCAARWAWYADPCDTTHCNRGQRACNTALRRCWARCALPWNKETRGMRRQEPIALNPAYAVQRTTCNAVVHHDMRPAARNTHQACLPTYPPLLAMRRARRCLR